MRPDSHYFYAKKGKSGWEIWVSYVGAVCDLRVCGAASEEIARETVAELGRARIS